MELRASWAKVRAILAYVRAISANASASWAKVRVNPAKMRAISAKVSASWEKLRATLTKERGTYAKRRAASAKRRTTSATLRETPYLLFPSKTVVKGGGERHMNSGRKFNSRVVFTFTFFPHVHIYMFSTSTWRASLPNGRSRPHAFVYHVLSRGETGQTSESNGNAVDKRPRYHVE